MGFSQRLPAPRRLAERVADLDAVLAALDVDGPVVVAGHDWGGAVGLGWAVRHRTGSSGSCSPTPGSTGTPPSRR